ncbi:MAG: M28 family peptidase [Rhodopirellula sp.]|nr:M28 family peptidase [Rhodopirellula sp.]
MDRGIPLRSNRARLCRFECLESRMLLSGRSLAELGAGAATRLSAPVAGDDYYWTPADTPLVVSAPGLLTNDYDPAGHRLEAVNLYGSMNLEHGTLYMEAWTNDGSFEYRPYPGHNGRDTFEYYAFDPDGWYDEATVTIDVGIFNRAPLVADPLDDVVVQQGASDTVIDLDTVFTDLDFAQGDFLTYTVTVSPPILPVVNEVSQSSYEHIHQDLLYTHLGDSRGYNSPQHDLATENIYQWFDDLGLTTTYDTMYEVEDYLGNRYDFNPPLVNVVGVKPGVTRPDEVYIIGAHYDSVGNPGADDNASGVAAVMEIARVLAPYSFDRTIEFIAFDGEEDGLFGSLHYTEFHTVGKQVMGMISADMIAYNQPGEDHDVVSVFDSDGLGQIKYNLIEAFGAYGGGLTARNAGMLDASDHAPFEFVGYDAALVIESAMENEPFANDHYHQSTDAVETPDYIDYEYATKITGGLTGYLAQFAGLLGTVDVLTGSVSDNLLTIDYDPARSGGAVITVRATDSEGLFAEDSFSITVEANDFGITLTESDGSTQVREATPATAADRDTYDLVLQRQPSADVVITADPDSQIDLGAGPGEPVVLTFTAGNWDQPQTVTVSAVDDQVPENAHSGSIVHTVASADAGYNGVALRDVVVEITDNDFALITETAGGTVVSTQGGYATYSIVLPTEPTADVTIFLQNPDGLVLAVDDANPANAFLTFHAAPDGARPWNVPQTVHVSAIAGGAAEGTIEGGAMLAATVEAMAEGGIETVIIHEGVSEDPSYQGSQPMAVTLTDDGPASASVVGRWIFYDNSYWDGNVAGPNDVAGGTNHDEDDDAIAPDKVALVGDGATQATAANYTDFSGGITGIMIDVADLVDPNAIDAFDFVFKFGNDDTPDDWTVADGSNGHSPSAIGVRDLGAGVTRVTITWDRLDGPATSHMAVPTRNWLQVSVLADADTGLDADDVFYFGNAAGDLNGDGWTLYDDIYLIYSAINFSEPSGDGVAEAADINRDGWVLYDDIYLCYSDIDFGGGLNMMTPPLSSPPQAAAATDAALESSTTWMAEITWLESVERDSGRQRLKRQGLFSQRSVGSAFAVHGRE